MSQQHISEEEFYDGPPSSTSYQPGYIGAQPQPTAYTTSAPPGQTYVNIPGQKLLVHDLSVGRAPGTGARLALAIVSLVFTFLMFMVTLIVAGTAFDNPFPVTPLAIFFALIFAGVVLFINIIFNRRN